MDIGKSLFYLCYVLSISVLKWLRPPRLSKNLRCNNLQTIDAATDDPGWDLCTDTYVHCDYLYIATCC